MKRQPKNQAVDGVVAGQKKLAKKRHATQTRQNNPSKKTSSLAQSTPNNQDLDVVNKDFSGRNRGGGVFPTAVYRNEKKILSTRQFFGN